MLKISGLLQSLHAGCMTSDGKLPDAYRIPRSLPAAFRDLVLLLIFESAALSRAVNERSSISNEGSNISAAPLFAQAQVSITFRRCKDALGECKSQLVSILGQNKSGKKSKSFDMVSGEDISTMVLANLQNRLMTEQGDFLLAELYTEYATKMVSNMQNISELV